MSIILHLHLIFYFILLHYITMASIVSQLRPSLLPRSVSRLFVPQQHSAIHAHGVLTQCCHTAGFRSHVMASVAAAAAAKTDYVSESKVRSARYTCVYDTCLSTCCIIFHGWCTCRGVRILSSSVCSTLLLRKRWCRRGMMFHCMLVMG